jgi:glucosylglycerate synthase
MDSGQAEDQIEELCMAYESEKPYLISRWRWPDRFTP